MADFIQHVNKARALAFIRSLTGLLILLVFSATQLRAQTYKTADEVPDPKDAGTGYITDAVGVLNATQTDSLNSLLKTLDQKTGVEAAVVVIDDFDSNDNDFDFATRIFRKWGIGKNSADNGLLLLVVTGRRQYRFITGYGLEGLLPDADLKTIGEHTLVPAFKQQNYGDGIISAANVIKQYLQQPANKKELTTLLAKQAAPASAPIPDAVFWLAGIGVLAFAGGWQISKIKSAIPNAVRHATNLYADVSGWCFLIIIAAVVLLAIVIFFFGNLSAVIPAFIAALPVLLALSVVLYFFFAHLSVLSHLRKFYTDDLNFTGAVKTFYKKVWWQALLSPLTLLFMLIEFWRSKQVTARLLPPADSGGKPMKRIDRDDKEQGSKHLSAGQLKEEQLGSQVYDVWMNAATQTVKLVQNPGYNFDDFTLCPECGFRTLTEPIQISLQKATYTRQGKAKRVKICRNCKHEIFVEEVTLPMLVQSSSSSSSAGAGSSSSSSPSSSSGSWGGGRTGGGGAGGSW